MAGYKEIGDGPAAGSGVGAELVPNSKGWTTAEARAQYHTPAA